MTLWTCSLINCIKLYTSQWLLSLWLLDDRSSCMKKVSFPPWMKPPKERRSWGFGLHPSSLLTYASGSTYHPRSWTPPSWQHWIERGSVTVAGSGGIYALNVSVAWILEELLEHCFDTLGLVDDGLSAHFQPAHRFPWELRVRHQLLHHCQAQGVDALLDWAEAHLGLAHAHCVLPCLHIVKLLHVCLVHIMGWEIDLQGKDAHILWPSISFGQGDSRDCRKRVVEETIKIPLMGSSQFPQKTVQQSFHSFFKKYILKTSDEYKFRIVIFLSDEYKFRIVFSCWIYPFILSKCPSGIFIAKYMWNKQRLWEYRRQRGQFQTGAEKKWRKIQ